MFGMSSKEFWEEDPQLYWAFRTFYLKQKEFEQKEKTEYLKYESWLKGNMTYMAQSIALSNAFSKSHKDFPSYENIFENQDEVKKTTQEINLHVQKEFNDWARY